LDETNDFLKLVTIINAIKERKEVNNSKSRDEFGSSVVRKSGCLILGNLSPTSGVYDNYEKAMEGLSRVLLREQIPLLNFEVGKITAERFVFLLSTCFQRYVRSRANETINLYYKWFIKYVKIEFLRRLQTVDQTLDLIVNLIEYLDFEWEKFIKELKVSKQWNTIRDMQKCGMDEIDKRMGELYLCRPKKEKTDSWVKRASEEIKEMYQTQRNELIRFNETSIKEEKKSMWLRF
jgi:hypothetical protein